MDHCNEREFDSRHAALKHARGIWGLGIQIGDEMPNGVSLIFSFTPHGYDTIGTLKRYTF